ncbi:uncharacterized protein BX664DRAFT_389266 [Halteromyces radiatus]|uniref:uncharacterized protein n=1 Tax=Halteromyces radiatus TaxID=101107 RepID=UPI00221EA990|nr:uncharacterized protein BX664DRAFT_389266 [Halteromyces radiatus]KAI8078903.1 hypothetical protein BX664DRAFT_389266 [Halteromyces radiatus]
MRRLFRYITTKRSPIQHYSRSIGQQYYTTTTLTKESGPSMNALLDKKLMSPLSLSVNHQEQQPLSSQQRNGRATTNALSQFYRGLSTQNLDQLWPFYSTLYQHQLHTRLTRTNYRRLIQLAAREPKTQKNLHRLLALMEDMQQLGFSLRLSDYNIVMSWIGGATVPEQRGRHLTEALEWMMSMEKQQSPTISPSVVTFNTLIHVASQANDIVTAQRLYNSMLAKGIQADAYTYTTLLHSMATMGDVQGVQEMMTRLENKGLGGLLNRTVTWNVLLDCYYGFSSSNDCMGEQDDSFDYQSKADHMFQSMQHNRKDGLHMAPAADTATFQIYIDYLLRQNRQTEAIQTLLITMLQQYQVKPTITVYDQLFASFMNKSALNLTNDGERSSSSQLRQLYQSMQEQTYLRPTSRTLYTLINALLDHDDTTFALETFVSLCQQENLSPCQELLDRLQGILQDNQDLPTTPQLYTQPSLEIEDKFFNDR